MISSLACTCSASHILAFHYPLKMSGLTGESQTLGQPSRLGPVDDNIWIVVERPNLQPDSKQLAPGRERPGHEVACREWAVRGGSIGSLTLSFCSSPCPCTHVYMYTHAHDSQLSYDKPIAPCPGEERRGEGRGREGRVLEREREQRTPGSFCQDWFNFY